MEKYEKVCSECGETFIVIVTTMNVPGCKSKEEIYCPFCNAKNGYRMTSGFVETYKKED